MSPLRLPENSPYEGLPASPRPNRQMLQPLRTDFKFDNSNHTMTSEKAQSPTLKNSRPRRQDSLIFVNATIPLSPTSTVSDDSFAPLEGLVPRKRSGLARLFCCFGREERARRRVMISQDYEKVGEQQHWTEY